MSQVTVEIVQGIAQAAANAYDGATDKDGKPIEIGLKREKGHPINDSRTMDGFKVRVDGNYLIVTYQTDVLLKDIYGGNFEDEMKSVCSDISKWLKKEYKKVTGNTLSISPEGDIDILVQKTSRVRVFAVCNQNYKIGSLKNVEDKHKPSEERMDNKFKKFLELGGLGTRAKNDKRKKAQ
jgi:hypothetical protein